MSAGRSHISWPAASSGRPTGRTGASGRCCRRNARESLCVATVRPPCQALNGIHSCVLATKPMGTLLRQPRVGVAVPATAGASGGWVCPTQLRLLPVGREPTVFTSIHVSSAAVTSHKGPIHALAEGPDCTSDQEHRTVSAEYLVRRSRIANPQEPTTAASAPSNASSPTAAGGGSLIPCSVRCTTNVEMTMSMGGGTASPRAELRHSTGIALSTRERIGRARSVVASPVRLSLGDSDEESD